MRGAVLGIDFGLTKCSVAVWDHTSNSAQMISTCIAVPSVVAFTDHGPVFGSEAQDQMLQNPQNTIFDIKRILCNKLTSVGQFQDYLKKLPFQTSRDSSRVKGSKDKNILLDIVDKNEAKKLTPELVLACLFRKLKTDSEAFLGQYVNEAVVSVPGSFSHYHRTLVYNAASYGGLLIRTFVTDTQAALCAHERVLFNFHTRLPTPGVNYVMVFDLGGGNIDVAIAKRVNGILLRFTSLISKSVGGLDFVIRIMNHLFSKMTQTGHVELLKDPKALSMLRAECERAMITLSHRTEAQILIPNQQTTRDSKFILTRSDFENMSLDLFEDIRGVVEVAVRDFKSPRSMIDEVLLLGKCSRIPRVREKLQNYFGERFIFNDSLSSDTAIAYGAARFAAASYWPVDYIPDFRIKPRELCPYGIEVSNGEFCTIVQPDIGQKTNQRSNIFASELNTQDGVRIKVYVGDEKLVKDNQFLGSVIFGTEKRGNAKAAKVPKRRGRTDPPQKTYLWINMRSPDIHCNGVRLEIQAWRRGKQISGTYTVPKYDDRSRMSRDHYFAEFRALMGIDDPQDILKRRQREARRELGAYVQKLDAKLRGRFAAKLSGGTRRFVIKTLTLVSNWLERTGKVLKEVKKYSDKLKLLKEVSQEMETIYTAQFNIARINITLQNRLNGTNIKLVRRELEDEDATDAEADQRVDDSVDENQEDVDENQSSDANVAENQNSSESEGNDENQEDVEENQSSGESEDDDKNSDENQENDDENQSLAENAAENQSADEIEQEDENQEKVNENQSSDENQENIDENQSSDENQENIDENQRSDESEENDENVEEDAGRMNGNGNGDVEDETDLLVVFDSAWPGDPIPTFPTHVRGSSKPVDSELVQQKNGPRDKQNPDSRDSIRTPSSTSNLSQNVERIQDHLLQLNQLQPFVKSTTKRKLVTPPPVAIQSSAKRMKSQLNSTPQTQSDHENAAPLTSNKIQPATTQPKIQPETDHISRNQEPRDHVPANQNPKTKSKISPKARLAIEIDGLLLLWLRLSRSKKASDSVLSNPVEKAFLLTQLKEEVKGMHYLDIPCRPNTKDINLKLRNYLKTMIGNSEPSSQTAGPSDRDKTSAAGIKKINKRPVTRAGSVLKHLQETAPKPRVIGRTDVVVNVGLDKIKIESDYLPPLKLEPNNLINTVGEHPDITESEQRSMFMEFPSCLETEVKEESEDNEESDD